MARSVEQVDTFPSARIQSASGGLPIEVFLISQLGPGMGDQLHAGASARQRAHPQFEAGLDEPSTRLAAADFAHGETSALFSFAVGPQGHPFHRHAGHRVFTAITGSGGAQLRFSTASDPQIEADAMAFIRAMHCIRLPPDCLFTVRFGGGTWHQFAPLKSDSAHPVLFALSCHTNELGGPLSEATRQQILQGQAGIASLTEILPTPVQVLFDAGVLETTHVPTLCLALHASPESWKSGLCQSVRSVLGRFRHALAGKFPVTGFVSGRRLRVQALPTPSTGSLLETQLQDGFHHQDSFRIRINGAGFRRQRPENVLANLLDGFMHHPPAGVSALMRLRNLLVKPLRLRTSPLGCPVSSLLSANAVEVFDDRFPVLAQQAQAHRAQVILGADDRHLRFRSCVGVEIIADDCMEISMATRVQCSNTFGFIYMALISTAHRRYVAPAMLRQAVEALPIHDSRLHWADGLFA